jgi:hypothetical protein
MAKCAARAARCRDHCARKACEPRGGGSTHAGWDGKADDTRAEAAAVPSAMDVVLELALSRRPRPHHPFI